MTKEPRWDPTTLLNYLRGVWNFDVPWRGGLGEADYNPDAHAVGVTLSGKWGRSALLTLEAWHHVTSDNVQVNVDWRLPSVVVRLLVKPGQAYLSSVDVQVPRTAAEATPPIWAGLLGARLADVVGLYDVVEVACARQAELNEAVLIKAAGPFSEVFGKVGSPPSVGVVGWRAQTDDTGQEHVEVEFLVDSAGQRWCLGISGSLEEKRDVKAVLASIKAQGAGWWVRWIPEDSPVHILQRLEGSDE